ncbi:coatomer subunit zeta-2 isoform X2 [Heteronotia binoei]|uniref:coatomer subunit zeta-2 isoform X2 n=1 Tax=Heteronotia binoei TaxID=13085 RepID=UPI0029317BC2|nr:coatomer subunit zeta-2 isoform X2 [Heteronotia binoei]
MPERGGAAQLGRSPAGLVESAAMHKAEARPRQHDHPGAAARGAAAASDGGRLRPNLAPPRPTECPAGLMLEPSLYTVKAIFILDSFGQRLQAKYYDDTFPSTKEQKIFEKNVFNKTHKTDSEIAFLEGLTIVYKSSIDLFLYVVGSSNENELMLMLVLNCLFESLNHMLRKNVEKRTLVENMDGAFLVVDEIIDGGVILESDPQQVVQNVNFRVDDSPLSEHSVAQVLQSAKEQIKWSLLK